MSTVKFIAFTNFRGLNQAHVANYFSAKYNINYCDSYNLLYALSPTIVYTYPDFDKIEIHENNLEAFEAGINLIKGAKNNIHL